MEYVTGHSGVIYSLVIACVYLLGILSAVDALNLVRSSQSAVAWSLSLVTFPWGALPLYWIFGRSRFVGYRELHKKFLENHRNELQRHRELFEKYYAHKVPLDPGVELTLEKIAHTEFTRENKVELLIDGKNTYDSMKEALLNAKRYIFFQFYILRHDGIGCEFKEILIAKAREGLRVQVLYDEIGSDELSLDYLHELANAGVQVRPFETRQGWANFFQFNFRNHRKIIVVDGQIAFVGGLNVGDEYLGLNPKFGKWRDTQLKIVGPSVFAIQSTFLLDWSWATQASPPLEWVEPLSGGDQRVLPIASGPADEECRGLLIFLEVIRAAQKRLWIATPYFVPDESILNALKLAALRGVDVRLLLPGKPDSYLVWLASFFYIPEVARSGVKVFRYGAGFMHQKVLLVDDTLTAIGTSNLDNRSLKLNFEINVFVADKKFAEDMTVMFEKDFAHSRDETMIDFDSLPHWQRLGAKFARLFSPIL